MFFLKLHGQEDKMPQWANYQMLKLLVKQRSMRPSSSITAPAPAATPE